MQKHKESPVSRRRAFTTIELLVVISIIILLGGILIYAVSGVLRTSRERATRVMLENAGGLLNEYESTTKLSINSRPVAWLYGGVVIDTTAGNPPNYDLTVMDFWHTPYVPIGAGAGTDHIPQPAVAPGASVTAGSPARDANDMTMASNNDAILNTLIAMQKITSNSSARASLGKIASDSQYLVNLPQTVFASHYPTLVTLNPQLAASFPNTQGQRAVQIPILLDAWNNPIIFAPGAGLLLGSPYDANRSYSIGDCVLSANGSFKCIVSCQGVPPNTTANWAPMPAVTSPDKRPFFASAGPDGDFSKADDNVYSFEK